MNFAAIKPIALRALAFASTLMMSLAVVGNMTKFKERRQRYFADAAVSGNLSRMQLLHLTGANVNTSGKGYSPLLLAAGEGRLAAVRYLLAEGANVNAREKSGNTALTEATYYGQVPIMKELLVRGADVNAITSDGTALDIAISKNNLGAIDLLKHHDAKRAAELR